MYQRYSRRQIKSTFLTLSFILTGLMLSGFGYAAGPYKYDFGGQTLRFSYRWETITPLGPRDAFNWYNPDPRLQAHIDSVAEMFNCKIEFVRPNGERVVEPIRQGVLAGDLEMDFVQLSSLLMPALALDGFLLPLDDVLEEDYWEMLPDDFNSLKDGFKVAGQTYGVPAHGTMFSDPAALLWNKTKFEEQGLPNLYELYENGEWTWDVFRELCRVGTRDTNGDGVIDQWGARLRAITNWMGSNNGSLVDVVDGRYQLTVASEENAEAWNFIAGLVQEGVADWYNANYADRVLFFESFAHLLANWTTGGDEVVKNYEWGVIPYPKGPRATEYVSFHTATLHGGVLPISVKHDPRAIIEVNNALQQITKPYIYDIDAWSEEYWRDRVNSVFDHESLEIWRWIDQEAFLFPDPFIQYVFDVAGWKLYTGGTVGTQIVKNGRSASTVLAEFEPQAQAIIDELLNQ